MTTEEKAHRLSVNPVWGGFMSGKKHSIESKIKMSATRQGIPQDQWTGFIRTTDQLERTRFRHQIQKSVFERDNYTCQLCLVHGVALQVDHIQPWAEYVEGRFDVNNCRTLCMSCHYKITFGREKPEGVTTWGHNYSHIGG
jgi:5-methylcytosine-specific restriction endonuclease McrA